MKIMLMLKRIFYVNGAASLPIGICLVVFFLNLLNGMATTNLASYLPQLIKTFNVTEVNVGKYAGVVSSSLSIIRIGSSLLWGYVCDKFGRKVALLFCGSGYTVATLLFGFTINYVWTVVTRSFQGLFMGFLVITKSLIADISDDSNLSIGLNFIFSGNNIGFIIGPSIAGFLVFPVEKYPKVFAKDGFFDVFKILLPNLIISIGLIVVLLVAFVVLPRQKVSVDESEKIKLLQSDNNDDVQKNGEISLVKENISKLKTNTKFDSKDETESELKYGTVSKFREESRYKKLLRNKNFILSISLYGMSTMTTGGFDDLFPVFAATDVKYNGLSMKTSDIGTLYFATGLTVVVIQFTVITKIVARFGAKKVFSVATVLFSIQIFLLPTTNKIKNRTFLWVALWLTQCLMRTTYNAGVMCVNIFINNSVDSEQLGVANGLALSVSSIGRFYHQRQDNILN
ncbi:uncharacterized protein LOC105845772 isoform X2 [Hydra vulgaris]|uniref:uncharacterized protein LOC105845772 isoform X2 n=1 Tax=Hydra vulgaris TaxID=6087 RepID=UPI001F5F1E13|nr:protein ZINC INDUCED FACILITATOR-LIKE 1-like isoform X2 [Hydra vulgaris]